MKNESKTPISFALTHGDNTLSLTFISHFDKMLQKL